MEMVVVFAVYAVGGGVGDCLSSAMGALVDGLSS